MIGAKQRASCDRNDIQLRRYKATLPDKDKGLVTAIRKISEKKPRWGYRRITIQLRKGDWDVSTTRVQRLCRLHGIVVVRTDSERRADCM